MSADKSGGKVRIPVKLSQSAGQNIQNAEVVGGCSSSASTSTATAKPKKPKKQRLERKRQREEKFYQALYQNKDSHIQFVSADFIRRFQNDGGKSTPSSSQPVPKARNRPTPTSVLSASGENQSSSVSGPGATTPLQTFAEFPCLNTAASSSVKRQFKHEPKPSPGPTPTSPPSSTTPQGEDSNSRKIVKTSDRRWEVPVELSPTAAPLTSTPKAGARQSPDKPAVTPITVASCAKGRKSKQPLVIEVAELIVKKEKDKFFDKRAVGVSSSAKTLKTNYKVTPGNPLDASGPSVINRGKIRNKKKKPTKLKLTILKSRALRNLLMERKIKQENESFTSTETVKAEDESSETLILEGEGADDTSADETKSVLQGDTPLTPDRSLPLELECPRESEAIVKSEPVCAIKTEPPSFEESDKEKLAQPDGSSQSSGNGTDFQTRISKLFDEISVLKIEETISQDVENAVKFSMHNRRFRDYCDMYTSKELHHHVIGLLSALFRFQDRLYHTDPIKFKTKRRFVTGLKEALSYLTLNKVQLLLIAANIEKNPEPGGLDDKLNQILTLAKASKVPYVFSGNKYTLGKPIKIRTPVSIVAVLDKQNCEEVYQSLLTEATQLREKYRDDFITKAKELMSTVKKD